MASCTKLNEAGTKIVPDCKYCKAACHKFSCSNPERVSYMTWDDRGLHNSKRVAIAYDTACFNYSPWKG